MGSNSTTRFSDRVEDYVKYRPRYPAAIVAYLQEQYGFGTDWVVADIGSGTGISTELFLRNGNKVFAVEPNPGMRAKAEEILSGRPGFETRDGTAESTGLPDASARLIVAGQAFHWFDPVKTRPEFVRIGTPDALVALVWNERLMVADFERGYESLILTYAGDYKTINHKNVTDDRIGAFFQPGPFVLRSFENEQRFDFEGLKGRLLSSSYIPKEGPRFDQMTDALRDLFERHAAGGQVRVRYETKVYTGRLR